MGAGSAFCDAFHDSQVPVYRSQQRQFHVTTNAEAQLNCSNMRQVLRELTLTNTVTVSSTHTDQISLLKLCYRMTMPFRSHSVTALKVRHLVPEFTLLPNKNLQACNLQQSSSSSVCQRSKDKHKWICETTV